MLKKSMPFGFVRSAVSGRRSMAMDLPVGTSSSDGK
jgi:hypothetical protein